MVMDDADAERRFPTAGQDATTAERAAPSPRTASPSYRLAYADQQFLLRDELRPVRLQLELLKPELLLDEHGVQATVVVFGSARIPDEDAAGEALARAVAQAERFPDDDECAKRVQIARTVLEKSRYYTEARRFARLVSERSDPDCVIVTGGGPGIMEAANRGASDAAAPTVGLNIVLPHEQVPNDFISPELCFQFHYFAIRKMHFLMRARALAAFPGGFGTMDELFETLTLIQTKKIRRIPVLLFGEEYWRRVVDFEALEAEGVIDAEDLELLCFVESAEAGWDVIERFYRSDRDAGDASDSPAGPLR